MSWTERKLWSVVCQFFFIAPLLANVVCLALTTFYAFESDIMLFCMSVLWFTLPLTAITAIKGREVAKRFEKTPSEQRVDAKIEAWKEDHYVESW